MLKKDAAVGCKTIGDVSHYIPDHSTIVLRLSIGCQGLNPQSRGFICCQYVPLPELGWASWSEQ